MLKFSYSGSVQDEVDKVLRETRENEERITYTEEQVQAIESQLTMLRSPEWTTITKQYLPSELHRIMRVAMDETVINPMNAAGYEREHLIAYGQAKECRILIERLSAVETEYRKLKTVLAALGKVRCTLQSRAKSLHDKMQKAQK